MSQADKFENTIKIEYVESGTKNENKNENENEDTTETKDDNEENDENDENDEKIETNPDDPIIFEMASNVKYPFTIQHQTDLHEKYSKHFDLLKPFRKPHWMEHCVSSKMVIKEEVRPSVIDGSSLHIEFDVGKDICENEHFSYQTADNLGICVRNDYKLVGKLCKRLKLYPDRVIRIKAINENEPLQLYVPKVTTIRNLFLWHLDITEMPRKGLMAILAQFATDDGDRAELTRLAESGVQKTDFLDFYQILEKYPSVNIDLASVIEVLRPLQPRLYTIASSNKVQPS